MLLRVAVTKGIDLNLPEITLYSALVFLSRTVTLNSS